MTTTETSQLAEPGMERTSQELPPLFPWERLQPFSRFIIAYYNSSTDPELHRPVSRDLLHAAVHDVFPELPVDGVEEECRKGMWSRIREFSTEHPDAFSSSIEEMVTIAGGGDRMRTMAEEMGALITDRHSHSAKLYLDNIAGIALYGVKLPEPSE